MTNDAIVRVAAVGALALAACVLPTERSADLQVVLDAIPDLFANDTIAVHAHVVDADGMEVPVRTIAYTSTDPSVVIVTRDGRALAAGSGIADVMASAPSMENARTARASVRVFGAVEIDSVQPTEVRYGEVVRLYGVGLNPEGGISAVRIDGHDAPIVGYAGTDPARPEGIGVLEVIVTPPVGAGAGVAGVADIEATFTVANARGGASLVTPFTVDMRDRFEPNDTIPTDLGVIGDDLEIKGLALDHFPAGVAQVPVDWYAFTTDAPGDWTITLQGTEAWVRQPELLLLSGPVTMPIMTSGARDEVWWIVDNPENQGVGSNAICRGFAGALVADVDFIGNWSESSWGRAPIVRLPLEDLPAGTHQLMIGFGGAPTLTTLPWGPGYGGGVFRSAVHQYWVTPGVDQEATRYDLHIARGIAAAATLDAYEGNDFCTDAPTLLTLGSTAFADSTFDLSIDAEFDWDWFRIGGEVTGRLHLTVSSETMTVAPRVYVYQPSPGMTGPVDRMTIEALTVFGNLRSDRDGQSGMSIDTVEYYVVVSPNAGSNIGVSRQGEPGTYRLSFSWDPAAPPIAEATTSGERPLAAWPGVHHRRPPTERP